ncbi:MAG: hypothetical protein NC218_12585, partial [Acetobacter sp.]|nr:hypothetical protein [Acetobacter sp.]
WHPGGDTNPHKGQEDASSYPTDAHYCFVGGPSAAADSSNDSKYLVKPDFTKITVEEINFRDSDGNLIESARISPGTGVSLATNSKLVYGKVTSNGIEASEVSYRAANKGVYTMNKLPGYVYGASATASVTTIITLLYNGENGNKEYFEVSVPTVVTRDVSFTPNTNNVVRDGDPFLISDYMTVYAASSLDSFTPTFYDDTIKFTLPSRAAITFSITRERAGEKVSSKLITIQNTAEYTLSEYRSISAILGDTSQPTDKLTLNIVSHSNSTLGILDSNDEEMYRGFYMQYGDNFMYLADEVDSTTKDYRVVSKNSGVQISTSAAQLRDENNEEVKFVYPLTASTGLATFAEGKDKINIISSRRIKAYNEGIDITKYYIGSLQGVDYQVAQAYRVTSYYQDMSQNAGADVKAVRKYLTLKSTGEADTVIVPRLGWTDGMTLNIGRYSYTGLSTIPYDSFNNNANGKLYYRISSQDGSSGAATIDNNGMVTTTANFSISAQHFVVNVYVKASGLDGSFSRESEYDKLLGSVTFMLEPPQGTAGGALGTVNGLANQRIITSVDATHNKIISKNIVMQAGEYKVEDEELVLTGYNGKEVISTISQVILPSGMEITKGTNEGEFGVGGVTVKLVTSKTAESFVLIKGQPLYTQANDENTDYQLNGRKQYILNSDWTEGGNVENKYRDSGTTFSQNITVKGDTINADGYIEYKTGGNTYYFKLSDEEVKVKYTQIVGRILNEDTPIDRSAVNADGYVRFTDWTNGERYFCRFLENDISENGVTVAKTYKKKLIVNANTEVLANRAAASGEIVVTTLDGNTFYTRLTTLYSAVGTFGYKVSGV